MRSELLRSYRCGSGARFWNRQTHLSLRHKRPYTRKSRVVTADAGPRSSEQVVTADGVKGGAKPVQCGGVKVVQWNVAGV